MLDRRPSSTLTRQPRSNHLRRLRARRQERHQSPEWPGLVLRQRWRRWELEQEERNQRIHPPTACRMSPSHHRRRRLLRTVTQWGRTILTRNPGLLRMHSLRPEFLTVTMAEYRRPGCPRAILSVVQMLGAYRAHRCIREPLPELLPRVEVFRNSKLGFSHQTLECPPVQWLMVQCLLEQCLV